MVVADEAHFQIGEQWRRPWSALVAGLPFVFAVTVLFTSKSWIAFNRAIRPEWLIGVQLYRVAGGLFLFPFLAYGVVPAGFAWPAGVGDVLTGAFAPLVARMVAQRWRGAFGVAVIWNLFGILDLVVAPAAAILSRAPVIEIYPLSLVPLFLGPPLGILIHLHSLQNLFAHRGELGRTETWPRVA